MLLSITWLVKPLPPSRQIQIHLVLTLSFPLQLYIHCFLCGQPREKKTSPKRFTFRGFYQTRGTFSRVKPQCAQKDTKHDYLVKISGLPEVIMTVSSNIPVKLLSLVS